MIPPMILFKGKRKKNEWMDNLPAGSVIEMTDKGSMTTSVFVRWLHHFANYKPPGKVLLIFDGASSHLDASIVDAAASHEITPFCLPSNTTHELQSMDKAVFKAFESYWDDEVMLYWTNKPDRTIKNFSFGLIFSKVWPKATAASNIILGFLGTGIYPYDPNAIPDIAFAPSEITQKELPLAGSSADGFSTIGSSSQTPSTSTATVPTFSRYTSKKRNIINMDLSEEGSSSSESSGEISLHDSSSSLGDKTERNYQSALKMS